MQKWHLNVRITVRDLSGNIIEQVEKKNLIVNVGLNMVRDVLAGDVTDGEIKVIGIGTDATAPAVGQTQLIAEVFRKARTSDSKPAVGQYESVWYIAPAEAVVNIREVGFFAGAAALVGTPNSGIMIARILYSRNKTALESIQFERLDSFEEA